jgi:histidinol-phosphatase (PHP family)
VYFPLCYFVVKLYLNQCSSVFSVKSVYYIDTKIMSNYHNYHTHTTFCDGSDKPENYVLEAIRQKMTSLGFSGHAPVPFENSWSTKQENMDEYFRIIDNLKNKYSDKLNIFKSLEIDYIPGLTKDFHTLRNSYSLDYTIGSVHLVRDNSSEALWFIDGPDKNYVSGLDKIFNNDIQDAVGHYYRQIQEMVINQQPDIIGHIDKIKMNNKGRYFNEDEAWYRKLVNETLHVIAAHKCIVEVNTRGIYKKRTDSLFPSEYILKLCLELGIPVTVSSDAHSPSELTNYFPEAFLLLKQIGFKGIQVLTDGKWRVESL